MSYLFDNILLLNRLRKLSTRLLSSGGLNLRYLRFVALAAGILAASSVMAAGLGLGVGDDIYVNNAPAGQRTAVSTLGAAKLKIINKGDSANSFIINILKSSDTTAPMQNGYGDIPDSSWIVPAKSEVKIAGHSVIDVELYLDIPKNKEYYGKKYQAVIEVKTKQRNPGDLFVLACQLKICFSIKEEIQ